MYIVIQKRLSNLNILNYFVLVYHVVFKCIFENNFPRFRYMYNKTGWGVHAHNRWW